MKFLLTLITFLTFWVSSFAAPISESAAREKAARFLTSKKGGSSAARSTVRRSIGAPGSSVSLTAVDNQKAYYVFNVESSNGYVIVSGDDRMPDVLGYSYSGSYNPDSIPDNMKAWLQGYADEYLYLQSHSDVKAASLTSVTGGSILPMIPTHWSQNYPYNALCPTIQGQSTVTGCVATAMSQVMYYHQWPKQTTKKIPAYTTTTASIRMPAIDANTTIDWDNMSPTYGYYCDTETMNKAVANIMLLAGCSVKMNYGLGGEGNSGSGAFLGDAADALKEYFDYESSLSYLKRNSYSGTQDSWNQMVYNELKHGRPVIYGGQGSNGGHAFIVDGYDANDLFHINWGWNGSYDGYFLLTALNTSNGTFNSDQEAVFGIEGKGNPEHKYAYVILDENVLTFYYDNNRESRSGTMLGIEGFPWMQNAEYRNTITKVVFDDSFKDYTKLTTAKRMFANMSNLTTIEGLTNLDTRNVKDMYCMFYNCQNINNLDFSKFNTKNVTDMYYMFNGCATLNSIDLSSFDTQNVLDMNGMFWGCESAVSIDVSNFDTKNVTDMSTMFYDCLSLTSLDISSFDTKSVKDMSYMFRGCTALEKIYAGEAWTTENVENSDYMFNGCQYTLTGQDGTQIEWGDPQDATMAHYGKGGLLSCKLRGDANGDGVIDKEDAQFVTDIILGTRYDYDIKTADANGDGIINMSDIMFIVNYILNGEFPQPEEEPEEE